MDDDQKDVAIIEASALLATLVFIVLSLYMSYYTQWYAMWQHECSSNPQCVWPPYLAEMSALVGTLEPFTYVVGFFFVVAASAATIHLFKVGSAWRLAAVRIVEIIFFVSGLGTMAVMFFFRAPRDINGFMILVLVTLFAIVASLVYAYHYRQLRSLEPLST